jgi:hypothetical protein
VADPFLHRRCRFNLTPHTSRGVGVGTSVVPIHTWSKLINSKVVNTTGNYLGLRPYGGIITPIQIRLKPKSVLPQVFSFEALLLQFRLPTS